MPTIRTQDGAVWGYGRTGRRGGKPVIVHHGLVGNGAFGPIWTELGETAGLEWIMIERPGYGETPPREMARLADWPAMIAPVLDALGVAGGFDVAGLSAGAPYAYACAAGMPARVGRVAILSGIPFIHAPGVLDAYPPEGRSAYRRYVYAAEADLRDEFRTFCRNAAVAERGEISSAQMAAALDAILAHDAAGPAREARLQARAWGFDRSAIKCHVDVWHFDGDDMIPFEAARRSADGMPNAVRHDVKGTAHVASDAMLKDMAEILAQP